VAYSLGHPVALSR